MNVQMRYVSPTAEDLAIFERLRLRLRFPYRTLAHDVCDFARTRAALIVHSSVVRSALVDVEEQLCTDRRERMRECAPELYRLLKDALRLMPLGSHERAVWFTHASAAIAAVKGEA
jgi:hypothetical protein